MAGEGNPVISMACAADEQNECREADEGEGEFGHARVVGGSGSLLDDAVWQVRMVAGKCDTRRKGSGIVVI